MEFRMRAATPDDAEGLARVHVAAWQAGYEGLIPADYLAGLSSDFERRVESWRTRVADHTPLLAESLPGGEVVGWTMYGEPRDHDVPAGTGELMAINLAPAAWGTGVAAALFGAAVRDLSATYDRIYLWVLDTNARAQRFYEKQGWRADGGVKVDESRGFVLRELRYSPRHDGSREDGSRKG